MAGRLVTHRPPPPRAALSAEIDARPLRLERNLSELILNAPEIINPLVGYHGAPSLPVARQAREICLARRQVSVPMTTLPHLRMPFPPTPVPPRKLPAVLPRLWPSSTLQPGTAIDTVCGLPSWHTC